MIALPRCAPVPGPASLPLNAMWHQSLGRFYAERIESLWAARRAPVRFALIVCLSLGGLVALGDAAYIKAKATVAQVLLHGAWAASLADPDGHPMRPWPHADTWPVARLAVARLGIDQIVLAGASGRSLAFGPAHLGVSSIPGSPGNAIISGHRDTHFRFLGDLELGDELTVTVRDGRTLTYRVTDLAIAHVDDVSIELVTPRRKMILVTCYPFEAIDPGTPYRYIVSTVLVDGTSTVLVETPSPMIAERQPLRPTGRSQSGRTQEPEPLGSEAGAFASAEPAAAHLDRGGFLGGPSNRAAGPRRPGLPATVEAFSNPREKAGSAGGRLVSQLGR